MRYAPARRSLRRHAVPDWYHDAKLGIFVHWGLYSVPAWAPLAGEQKDVTAREGWTAWFARNPYAEWYLNSLRIANSPTQQHHAATYGAGFRYERFVESFTATSRSWDASGWAELFQQAGARYVVLTTKHHDGYLLWPSRHPNPLQPEYQSGRDLVGELAEAVRGRGLRMGLYYSAGLDWTFNTAPVRDIMDLLITMPREQSYADYVDAHWRELLERYKPAVMWNDIGYPARADLHGVLADYYNQIPDGVVNDRFMRLDLVGSLLRTPTLRAAAARLLGWALSHMEAMPASSHCDFRTPEYSSFSKTTQWKWEATRGIGHSFGYNRIEGEAQYISVEELIHSFVDIVSKNGNLLLNVGPAADGTIPDEQRDRLLGLGRWLEVNGEAIYGTRPWRQAEGTANGHLPVRFTQKDNLLYAIVLGKPFPGRVTLDPAPAQGECIVSLLGYRPTLECEYRTDGLVVTLPETLPDSPAYVLRIEGMPKSV